MVKETQINKENILKQEAENVVLKNIQAKEGELEKKIEQEKSFIIKSNHEIS